MLKIVFTSLVALASFACHAEYIRTSPMKATVCTGFVIKSCGASEVSGIELALSATGKLTAPAGLFGIPPNQ